MSNLAQIVHLAATDPDFYRALLADSEKALAKRELQVSDEERSALSRVIHLLTLPSQNLLSLLLDPANIPAPWESPTLAKSMIENS